jgi:hypothetical protein
MGQNRASPLSALWRGVVILAAVLGAASRSAAAADGAYDVSLWLASLRPELRATAPLLAGVGKLDDLPLYDLDLRIDPSQASFSLRETIHLTNLDAEPRDEWVFRLDANANQSAPRVIMIRGRCVDSECAVAGERTTIVAVRTATPVLPRGRVEVELELRGSLERIDAARTNMLAQSIEGLASLGGAKLGASYGLLAQGEGIVSFADFYPVLARRRGAFWDRSEPEPVGDLGSDDLANVHAFVDLPQDFHLAHNGVVLRRTVDVQTHRCRTEVGAVLVRDFALVAGAGLSSSSASVGGVTVSSHYLAADRAAGRHVLDVATRALSEFERKFGPYPYSRFDLAEAPLVGGAGGVEFSGLVTVASMFYHPGPDFWGQSLIGSLDGMREFVTAHEVAHQWWHVLVGSDSRQSPFTDESLAQYSALLYLEARYGRDRAKRDGDTNVKANYQMMRLLGVPDGPVDAPADSFAGTLPYGGLVYGKGPYFFREARKLLGDAAFFRALRAYAAKYRFQMAPAYAIVDGLAASGHREEVRALGRRWLHEAHGDEDLGKTPSLLGMLGGQGGDQAMSGLLDGLDLGDLPSGSVDVAGLEQMLPGLIDNPEIERLVRLLLKQLPKDGAP